MVTNLYVNNSFGTLNASYTANDGCLPPSLTQSSIFSNTFTQSNTYVQSNTFTQSYTFSQPSAYTHRNTLSKSNIFSKQSSHSFNNSYTMVLISSYSITKTITVKISYVNTNSFTLIDLKPTFTNTGFIYYEYTIMKYSSHYFYYSLLFTNFYSNQNPNEKRPTISKGILIGIICFSIVIVFIVVGIIVFVVRFTKKAVSLQSTENYEIGKTTSNKRKEIVDNKFSDFIQNENDQWI